MIAKVKYRKDEVDYTINDVVIPCKPSKCDYLYLKELPSAQKLLYVTKITVVCRVAANRNMKQPDLLIRGELIEDIENIEDETKRN